MYNSAQFKDDDEQQVLAFMKHHPFAMLIGNSNGRAVATQVPLMIEEREGKLFLIGHITRKQDHQLVFEENAEALVVFTGAHAYVSASWYENPQMVSTWNYSSVHVRGRLKFLDEDGLITALRKLSLHYEKQNVQSSTIYDNLPAEYAAKMLKAIVGFEIEVASIDHVFKLSQNRDEKSYDNIISQFDMNFLGQIPIVQSIREGGDNGKPVMATDEEITKKAFEEFTAAAVRSIAMRNAEIPATQLLEIVS